MSEVERFEQRKAANEVMRAIYKRFYDVHIESRTVFHCKYCGEDVPDPWQHYQERHFVQFTMSYLKGELEI